MGDKNKDDTGEDNIPLLHDVVFDASLPLKGPRKKPQDETDHGPDYDPDTLDLFEDAELARAEEELRVGAERIINDLVEEFSVEINERLRTELSDQLNSILDDLGDLAGDADKR